MSGRLTLRSIGWPWKLAGPSTGTISQVPLHTFRAAPSPKMISADLGSLEASVELLLMEVYHPGRERNPTALSLCSADDCAPSS